MSKLPLSDIATRIAFIGIIRYELGQYTILSNPRKTYITPPGQGFLPRETAWHHQNHVVALVKHVRNTF